MLCFHIIVNNAWKRNCTMKYLSRTCLLFFIIHNQFAYSDSYPLPASGETPASLACIYGLTPSVPGCRIHDSTLTPPNTGTGAIAIIDGQDDPNALIELTQFSNQLTPSNVLVQCNSNNTNQPCFQQYYVSNPFNPSAPCVVANNNASTYSINPTTDIEPALDIEWAHAMAPKASIYMVETQGWLQTSDPSSPNTTSLIQGLQCATHLLERYNGGGIVSYSNSNQEWPGETALDSHFQRPGIIYVASSGDYSAPARYPAASPYVIGAGGTSIQRDPSGNYIGQVVWNQSPSDDGKTGGSGGPSIYEPRPSYQNSVQKIVGRSRGTPDISFAAASIDVFCCYLPGNTSTGNKCCGIPGKPSCQTTSLCLSGQGGGWVTTGGTSLAAPALAGIINSAQSGARSSTEELTNIYTGAIKNYHSYWTDIVSGNNGYPALAGYDFTTGLGVPRGYNGK